MSIFLNTRSTWLLFGSHSLDEPTPGASTEARSRIGAISLQVATIAFLAASAPANALDLNRPLDRGGSIRDYSDRIAAGAGRRHVIDGDCMSACTMWLGRKGTCVTPGAVLWFHAATDKVQALRGGNPWRAISPAGNHALLASYPPRLRAVVAAWLESPDYHTLTGREVAALGVQLCDERSASKD